MGKCKCGTSHKKGCACKKGKCKKKSVLKCCKCAVALPVLTLLTCLQVIAPKKYRKSPFGKIAKITLLLTWTGILLHGILAVTGKCVKKKKHRK